MRYEKREFSGARLELDGNEYVNCKLISCTLVFRSTAPISLVGNEISGNTQIVFEGAAANTLGVLKLIWGMGEFGRATILKTFQEIAPDLKKLH